MNSRLAAHNARGTAQHGTKYDPCGVESAHPSVIAAFLTGQRVRVRATYADGETYERTGIVSITTGWQPAFILMHRSSDSGSSDVLGARDEVVAVRRGRTYVAA